MKTAKIALFCLSLVGVVACGDATDSDGAPGGAGGAGGTPTSIAGENSTAAGTSAISDGGEPAVAEPLPRTVNIELLGALIGPGKADTTEWDGTGTVPPAVLEALATAAGFPGTGAILDVIQTAAYQALSKPDPLGVGEINEGDGFDPLLVIPLTSVQTNEENTFTPHWSLPYPGWTDVAFDKGLQVRITMSDEDLTENDSIGTATVNFADLKEAWLAQDSHWIRVDDQTQNQLLAVQVQVTGSVE